jgi:RNA polymerase-binding transcription factor DksA
MHSQTGVDLSGAQALQRLLRRRRDELLVRSQRATRDLTHCAEPLVQDFADQATQTQNDATLEAIAAAAADEVLQIDHALERIERGDYGVCEVCGEDISPERLRAVPYAVRCARCG